MTCPLLATRLKWYLPLDPFLSTNLPAMMPPRSERASDLLGRYSSCRQAAGLTLVIELIASPGVSLGFVRSGIEGSADHAGVLHAPVLVAAAGRVVEPGPGEQPAVPVVRGGDRDGH